MEHGQKTTLVIGLKNMCHMVYVSTREVLKFVSVDTFKDSKLLLTPLSDPFVYSTLCSVRLDEPVVDVNE